MNEAGAYLYHSVKEMSPVSPERSGDTSAEQTIVFVIDDCVTLADGFFQSQPVNNRDTSARIFN
jgi:hypothetical protein